MGNNPFQRFFNGRNIAIRQKQPRQFGIQVPHPKMLVALNPVPNRILHVQKQRIGSGVVNFRQAVCRLEIADTFHIRMQESRNDFVDIVRLVQQEIDTHETEARISPLHVRVGRHINFHITRRMIVRSPFFVNFRTSFRHRFTKTDTEIFPRLFIQASIHHNANRTINFTAKVQNDVPLALDRTGFVNLEKVLHFKAIQQSFRIADMSFRFYNPYRQNKFFNSFFYKPHLLLQNLDIFHKGIRACVHFFYLQNSAF